MVFPTSVVFGGEKPSRLRVDFVLGAVVYVLFRLEKN